MSPFQGINRVAFDSRAEHPVIIPVTLDRMGLVASFQLEVPVAGSYEALLRFDLQRDDVDERKRLHSMLRVHRTDRAGKLVEPAVSTPVTLSVEHRQGSEWARAFLREVSPILSGWSNRSFYRSLGEFDFDVRAYRLHMLSRRCATEFENVPIQLLIRRQSMLPQPEQGSPDA